MAAPAPAPAPSSSPADKPQKSELRQPQLTPPPYWEARNAAFDKFFRLHQQEVAQKEKTPIKVQLGDKEVEAIAWVTTPEQLYVPDPAETDEQRAISPVVAARVGAVEWDLTRPLEPSCAGKAIEFLRFDSEAGRHVFWHSSAHILGEALEHRYHCLLNVGPATESDFFYDIRMPSPDVVVSEKDYKQLCQMCEKIVKEKQPFERCELTKSEAREVFAYNPYKLAIIERVPETERISAYRCGSLVDLCRGPHLPHSGFARAFSILSSSSVYLDGRTDSDVLQRVHGLSFPSKQQLKEWEALLAEAQRRDHRKIGQDQELFFVHPFSSGSAFFLPHGYRIYQKLIDFMREEHHRRGYQEVLAPNIYTYKLWEISGHWQHYKDNMFTFNVEDQPWVLKPMNCPGHCLMFAFRSRSYRELPIRMAEFGVLHRNELSGALHGLTRVRRFQQDDSHIFCRPDQIEQEVGGVLDLIRYTYGVFGFNFRLELSTRPEKFLGDIALWDRAEASLKNVLNKIGLPWKLNPGDGAFYGPKIDIHIMDALRRYHQCATCQLDFQLPIRFDLQYMTSDATVGSAEAKFERPVMIHRAIFGSIERFLAILIEHTGGKWPFWISPRQIAVVPVSDKFLDYARKVGDQLHAHHFCVDVDDSDRTLQKKIREAQIAQYNYILVVGQEEVESQTVNVRIRDAKDPLGKMPLPELLARLHQQVADHK